MQGPYGIHGIAGLAEHRTFIGVDPSDNNVPAAAGCRQFDILIQALASGVVIPRIPV